VAQVKAPGIPEAVRSTLAMQREAFMHAGGYQDGISRWWSQLAIEDRRLLLAFVGLDDSEQAAARAWPQMLLDHRDKLVNECKHLLRLVEGLKWA
jgi:hypothetical protein